MQPRRKDEQLAQEGRFKNRIIWFLLLMVGLSLYKFATYPDAIPVYTAPDISRAFRKRAAMCRTRPFTASPAPCGSPSISAKRTA